MRFEGREIKPYAVPVSALDLKEGAIYFSLTYFDDDMFIPILEPLFFVGRNLEPGDVGQVYFQDVYSYKDGIRYDSEPGEYEADFYAGSEDELQHMFEFENALELLLKCSLRRQKKLRRK
ncbi:MAG: hypothetical protein HC897_05480 [Thermoanaerobaculia bacterium]|nr:hypothetical protein [Thermoanaerobaculia bacterium]